MSGYTTPVALRGKHRAVHPLQYPARSGHGCGRVIGSQREAGARARLALIAPPFSLAEDFRGLETICDQGFRAALAPSVPAQDD
jgi:hypothetical protein